MTPNNTLFYTGRVVSWRGDAVTGSGKPMGHLGFEFDVMPFPNAKRADQLRLDLSVFNKTLERINEHGGLAEGEFVTVYFSIKQSTRNPAFIETWVVQINRLNKRSDEEPHGKFRGAPAPTGMPSDGLDFSEEADDGIPF